MTPLEYSIITGTVLLTLFVLWIFFLAVMSLDRAYSEGKLTGVCKYPGIAVLLIGWSLDTILQFTVFTVIFLDMPSELTISSRLTRYRKSNSSYGYRKTLAVWIAKNFLDPFDKNGIHIPAK